MAVTQYNARIVAEGGQDWGIALVGVFLGARPRGNVLAWRCDDAGSGAWMAIGRMVRRKARAAVAPAVFLALAGYFMWSANQGDRGLEAYAQRQNELTIVQAEHARTLAEIAVWERRVTALRSRLDTDALDERARAMLNLSDPADVIVQYDKGQKLF
jgi:cell division protein FtsB